MGHFLIHPFLWTAYSKVLFQDFIRSEYNKNRHFLSRKTSCFLVEANSKSFYFIGSLMAINISSQWYSKTQNHQFLCTKTIFFCAGHLIGMRTCSKITKPFEVTRYLRTTATRAYDFKFQLNISFNTSSAPPNINISTYLNKARGKTALFGDIF